MKYIRFFVLIVLLLMSLLAQANAVFQNNTATVIVTSLAYATCSPKRFCLHPIKDKTLYSFTTYHPQEMRYEVSY